MSQGPGEPARKPRRSFERRAGVGSAVRRMALEENRRAFLRMVSHELRTPLNSVIGFSEIISRELYGPISDQRYREHARIVHESGLRLLKLVNDVLEIARLEAGAMDLDLRAECPMAALQEALRSVAPDAAARGVPLELKPCPETPMVLADSRALQTVFANLLQNAIVHSPPGAPVGIGVLCEDGQVTIEISDHGEGVSKDDLARILRPFEQAESALVRRTEGAGLDLAIVGLLCQAMRGRFSVRSNPEQGLTAVVHLVPPRPASADPAGA